MGWHACGVYNHCAAVSAISRSIVGVIVILEIFFFLALTAILHDRIHDRITARLIAPSISEGSRLRKNIIKEGAMGRFLSSQLGGWICS